jgi:hypothetical protein
VVAIRLHAVCRIRTCDRSLVKCHHRSNSNCVV